VDRQAAQAAEKGDLEKQKAEVAGREKAAEALARDLIEKQKEILAKQKALEDAQKNLAETETQRDQEWERIKDEWKKIEDQRQAIEKKLASAETTAAEWQKLQAEWQKLDVERKKLEEVKSVKENVDQFRRGFDRDAYERGLAALRGSVSVGEARKGYVPFDFKFWTDKQYDEHLRYYGIVDLYKNSRTKKYLTVEDYGRGFQREGVWEEAFARQLADNYMFLIQRRTQERTENLKKAEQRIGAGVELIGLIPVQMGYEILYHRKKMLEACSIAEKDLAFFLIAPWRDEGGGRWMFKIIEARKNDGTAIKVGNYHF
jgi:hypothetical protein